jgi:hypothetical protein
VQASWFLLTHKNDSTQSKKNPDVTQLYIALLNPSQHELGVRKVIINSRDDAIGAAWYWPGGDKTGQLLLEPGRLVTLPIDFQPQTACRLPVEVLIQFDADTTQWHANRLHWFENKPYPLQIRAKLTGMLPSAIPEGWEENCGPSASQRLPLADQVAK